MYQEPLWHRIFFILYFALYFVPIGFPLMCITAPIWVLGIIARTPPLWHLGDVPRGFYYAPLLPFTWLAYCYRDVLLTRYNLYRNERIMRRIEPVPLPAKRPRRLSEGQTVGQTAPLLTRLPLEIRQIIYEDVIKCGSLHRHILELERSSDTRKKYRQRRHPKKRVWGPGCKAWSLSHCAFDIPMYLTPITPCSPVSLSCGPNQYIENSRSGPIALAKTCRQIYLEIIDMYYGQLIYGLFI